MTSLLRLCVTTALMSMGLSACSVTSCIDTHEDGCLDDEEFRQLVEETAAAYSDDPATQRQWGFEAINLPEAYANLELKFGPDTEPGEGVLVGVLDTGIDTAHPAFINKNIIERFIAGASDEDGSEFSHGTAVASIIAGEDDPDWAADTYGVAWGADLVMFAMPLGSPPEHYNPITLEDLPGISEFFSETGDEILSWSYEGRSIDFLNLSLGVPGVIDNFSEAELREHMAAVTATFAQADSDEKVVFVWAAGNAHETPCDVPVIECVDGVVDAVSPGTLSGLAARLPELRGHTVAVVAIGEDGKITDFSNRCGIAAEYCLAAPGSLVRVAYFGPFADGPGRGTARGGGTSYAAPMVTGGLALMKQYFRGQLSNTDLLARMLETADRTGPYADAEIYGRGLMDLGTATSPVGEETVVVSNRVNGPGSTLQQTSLELGSAFGDSVELSLAGREMAAFDSLGAPFWHPAGRFATPAAGPSQAARLREFFNRTIQTPDSAPDDAVPILLFGEFPQSGGATPALRLTDSTGSAVARASHFGLAGQSLVLTLPITASLTATAQTTEGVVNRAALADMSLVSLVWQFSDAPVRFRAGRTEEPHSLLGAVADGAFGRLSAGTTFAGIEADTGLGAWQLGFNAEVGTVNARMHDGLLHGLSDLATSAFSLHATRPTGKGSAFRVSFSQPLRTESGHAELHLPVGRTKSGEVVRDAVALGFEPSGRQLDLELHWQQPLGRGNLHLGAVLSHEPGHRKHADPDLTVLSGWTIAF
ncbi:MAG: S8 family serine peptidase [Paracoccaceae bacterium]|nr:S8 family serine peptidase [Paracoccaceae bacterium]